MAVYSTAAAAAAGELVAAYPTAAVLAVAELVVVRIIAAVQLAENTEPAVVQMTAVPEGMTVAHLVAVVVEHAIVQRMIAVALLALGHFEV